MKRKEAVAQYEVIRDRLETSYHYRQRAFSHAITGKVANSKALTNQAQGERDILDEAIRKAKHELRLAKIGLRKGDEEGVETLFLRFIMHLEEGLKKSPLMGKDYHEGQVEFLKRLRLSQIEKIASMNS